MEGIFRGEGGGVSSTLSMCTLQLSSTEQFLSSIFPLSSINTIVTYVYGPQIITIVQSKGVKLVTQPPQKSQKRQILKLSG